MHLRGRYRPRRKGGAVFDGATSGGGAFAGFNYPLTLVNCLFHGNGAYRGGGFCSDGREQTASAIVNCTIVHNYATNAGAGVYLSAPTEKHEITNGIAWDNRVGTTSYAETAQIGWAGGTPPTVTDTCIQNKSQVNGTGGISSDPDFPHGAQGDHRLDSDSPCRDEGLTAALPADVADLDDDTGEPIPRDLPLYARVDGTYVDMGAYEYQPAMVDCNGNNVPAGCDIAGQTSPDGNANDIRAANS